MDSNSDPSFIMIGPLIEQQEFDVPYPTAPSERSPSFPPFIDIDQAEPSILGAQSMPIRYIDLPAPALALPALHTSTFPDDAATDGSHTVQARVNRIRSQSFGTMSTLVDHSSYPVPHDEYEGTPSSSPPKTTLKPGHKRGYQACENCRIRKSRCEPREGDVDNPSDPPCKRCARERIECEFALTRKKRKTSTDPGEAAKKPVKRRLTASDPPYQTNGYQTAQVPGGVHQAPQYGSNGVNPQLQQWQPVNQTRGYTSQPHDLSYNGDTKSGRHVRSDVAKELLSDAVATTQDNLQMLVNAAVQTSTGAENDNDLRSPSMPFGSPLSANSSRARAFSNNTMTPGLPGFLEALGSASGITRESFAQDEVMGPALRTWERMRFVRAGWFTALEAMQYVEYYYKNMAPMTPIVIPDYRSPAKHQALLSEEPVLAIAILAIASRHMSLQGYAAVSRSYQVHDKLWTYLRNMVERLLWAQEQFGGGFCGAGAAAQVTQNTCGQLTWKGSLRTLGTVEAILLLTDWQPRALHFPPGDDENRLLTDFDLLSDENKAGAEAKETNTHHALPFASWLEPAWRSDRMSWMLLGLAQALSFELGVFDKKHYDCQNKHDPMSDCARKRRVRRLVLVYVSQNSGRLGIPSMLPLDMWEADPIFEKTNQAQRRGLPEDPIDVMQSCWLEIASIMYSANQKIFPSRQFTRDLTSSGQYQERIEEFRPLLQNWKTHFDRVSSQMQPVMRHILTMEYEYARTYINSLGLQKVVEAWVGKPNADQSIPDYLQATHRPNRKYIEDVADAAGNILKAVLGLAPGGHIRNAPTRIFTRALSGLLFTMKRFTLGAHEPEVLQSLDLLERTADLLGTSAVDDVHLANQTSRMTKFIMEKVKGTFIRVHPQTNGSEATSREGSRHHTPHQHEHEHMQGASAQRPRTTSSSGQQHSARDPLAAIPGKFMGEISSTIMPPPNYNFQSNGFDDSMPIDPSIDLPGWNTDWLTLPLDKFMETQADNMNVDQGFGGIGPTVGDRDMLEIITNQQYNQWNAGANPFHGFQG